MSNSVDLNDAVVSVSGNTDASIYDVSFDINFTSPSTFNVSFINQLGVYIKPTLDTETPQTLTIGGTAIKVYPVSYKIEKSGSAKTLMVQYADSGVKYLDKFLVSLKDIKNERVLNLVNVLLPSSGEASFSTGGYLLFQLLAQIKKKGIPISSTAESFINNQENFIPDEEYQKVFVLEDTGRLRDVLSAYGSKVGCVFFWNFLTEQLDAISIRRGLTKTEASALASSIEGTYEDFISSSSESASITDSVSKSLILYDSYDGQTSDRGLFCGFDRVIVEQEDRIDWIGGIGGITKVQGGLVELSDLVKCVYAKRVSSFTQYVYSELLIDAVKRRNTVNPNDSEEGAKGPDVSTSPLDDIDELKQNKSILSVFPTIQIVDYVSGTLSDHLSQLEEDGKDDLAQFFREATGAEEEEGEYVFKGVINNENTGGRPFFICKVRHDLVPESDMMTKIEDYIEVLAKTYNSLFVSRRKFSQSNISRFSLKYGEWVYEKKDVEELTPFDELKNIKLGTSSNVAFDPFYKKLESNSEAIDITNDEDVITGKKKVSGRMLIDLKLGESKFPSRFGESMFLDLKEAAEKWSSQNMGVQLIGSAASFKDEELEAVQGSYVLIFEDSTVSLNAEVESEYLKITAENNTIYKKFIFQDTAPTSLLYKYRLSSLSSPQCVSNEMQILKAPCVADVKVPETDQANYFSKIDLEYMIDFIEAQGGFLIPENSVTYSFNVEKLVTLDSSWLKKGLEGMRVQIGSSGVTCDLTISDRKKMFQSFDELAHLINVGHGSFGQTIHLRSSLPLLGPQTGRSLFG